MEFDYGRVGHATYGSKCEFDGCGWDAAQTDVHHISYQEQQRIEKELRKVFRQPAPFTALMAEARSKGFLSFDGMARQLEKDNRSTNLAILCPNHHRYVHSKDMGLGIIKHLPPRK